MTALRGGCYNPTQAPERCETVFARVAILQAFKGVRSLPVTLDLDKLKSTCDASKFRSFERELEQAVDREASDRRRKLEETKRAKEKRARKKRQKASAQAAS